ncbi:uroporphyrin-3 C-methyltransferase [Sphaerotilus hippei]|uniref:Uroporphyrin-3 C-methyltransferase n=2 Tax=Sphaerotilus hippei TaxID=744406 RepID=A0A318H1Y8_9BURK|nr:uroporphyrin-3 C-methyltransferase [Sphaerotilus hippei]
MALMAGLAAVSTWQAVQTHRQVGAIEQELVRRQQGSTEQSAEARLLARQSQDLARESAAKVSVLEEKLSEVALQRGQLEELILSLSRSRDENLVTDVEASLRVALQQSALTGSAEPLVSALRASEERLGRVDQPRLERVRRAISRDLERVRAVGVPDVGVLLIKLDEAVRLVDELPLLSMRPAPTRNDEASRSSHTPPRSVQQAGKAAAAAASAPGWVELQWQSVQKPLLAVWDEVRGLLRVTRIDRPEGMLVAPEQGYFVRENLKLRLLNARLSLLSRQYEAAASDLDDCQGAVNRYFDGNARRTQVISDLIRQVQQQGRQVSVPRPDETLSAIAALSVVR